MRYRQQRPEKVARSPSLPNWTNLQDVKINFRINSVGWTTLQVYHAFAGHGAIRRIEISEDVQGRQSTGYVLFSPPPIPGSWLFDGIKVRLNSREQTILCILPVHRPLSSSSSNSRFSQAPEFIRMPLTEICIGVMEKPQSFLRLYSWKGQRPHLSEATVDTRRKTIELTFSVGDNRPNLPNEACIEYKVVARFDQIRDLCRVANDDHTNAKFLMILDNPPFLFEGGRGHQFHAADSKAWNDSERWIRQCNIKAARHRKPLPLRLQDSETLVDIGRWLSYTFEMNINQPQSRYFDIFVGSLRSNNFAVNKHINLKVREGLVKDLWHYSFNVTKNEDQNLGDLYQMTQQQLEFETHYLLEACLSLGVIHECNITADFISNLASHHSDSSTSSQRNNRTQRLLQAAIEADTRIHEPMDIFKLVPKALSPKVPTFCALVHTAVVTPTTMYLSMPVVETSNRVVRQFKRYEDRFLRVRFTDERHYGRIQSTNDNEPQREAVFDRIRHVMTHGIQIGDRHFEFLAFGNSQFREHGAYFFAATGATTAASIRKWMGDFGQIRVIAKYASRLGLCLSTTRATSLPVTIEKIPDIERNGYTFSDGVGKLSPFLAQMMAGELGISGANCPSVFQFRLGGCKGILAVDSAARGNSAQIRPSQEKFPARYYGLEICRVSRFTSACLNMQIILVLSTLGVPDDVFINKMRTSLKELEKAMTDEDMAVSKLLMNVDFNGITLVLARMIQDGFMADPFLLSCLRLWRSWTVKHLKEKAHIYIEKGAFVLGCLDETGKLRGHFDKGEAYDTLNHDLSRLPEIFIQISSDPTTGREYKIVEGVCLLARNPSLHPGDVRVVRAVDIPELRHMRDCVVLPQTGDRDLASMCSGGDLDGDDYLVMWDDSIIPKHWNYKPMVANAIKPTESSKSVTVSDMTSFFVTHMKNDNLGRIAVAHRYWADLMPDGVNNEKCLELAQLHSIAVDYAKTGVPAQMPAHLAVKQWPHWSQTRNKNPLKIYHSKKVLGKLYDEVQSVPFRPAEEGLQFDNRILHAFTDDPALLQVARDIKLQYDEALLRIMAQSGIETEFEAWTTFAMSHTVEGSVYKFAEKFGTTISSFKEQFQDLCFERAGITRQNREWQKLGPLVAAMYKVTCEQARSGSNQPCLISFPWLFHRELGMIATKSAQPLRDPPKKIAITPEQTFSTVTTANDVQAPESPEAMQVDEEGAAIHEGDLLDLFHQYDKVPTPQARTPSDGSASESEEMPVSMAHTQASPWAALNELQVKWDGMKSEDKRQGFDNV